MPVFNYELGRIAWKASSRRLVNNFVFFFGRGRGDIFQCRRSAPMPIAMRVGALPIATIDWVAIERLPRAIVLAHRHLFQMLACEPFDPLRSIIAIDP